MFDNWESGERKDRLKFIEVHPTSEHQSFCAAVDEGLSQSPKSLPTRFLYDEAGSELFEQITELPEYYLTRCETEIFQTHALDIARSMPNGSCIVEFGSGSSKKTRLLIEAFLSRQRTLSYAPIDISAEFLHHAAEDLLAAYPALSVSAIAGEYFDVAANMPEFGCPRLVLFLGSNIGNFEVAESARFLRCLASQFTSSDRLLVGLDLAKDASIIEPAYNDSAGVTARFNLNLLARINKELDANFDLSAFEHSAPYLAAEQRVEMRLYSSRAQTVEIEGIGRSYELAEGEFIHTEWSHKYSIDSFMSLAGPLGWEADQLWFDEKRWFASVLLRRRIDS